MNYDKRYAVLIDADNISDKYVKIILDEISNDGIATYKRIYGDWTRPTFASWKSVLLEHSITPIQQYGYTYGKNATDSAMIIDAMDILYSGNVEGFALCPATATLRDWLPPQGVRHGRRGDGGKQDTKAFIAACNKFKYLDLLAQKADQPAEVPTAAAEVKEEEVMTNWIP
jgi:hypothetical protein